MQIFNILSSHLKVITFLDDAMYLFQSRGGGEQFSFLKLLKK